MKNAKRRLVVSLILLFVMTFLFAWLLTETSYRTMLQLDRDESEQKAGAIIAAVRNLDQISKNVTWNIEQKADIECGMTALKLLSEYGKDEELTASVYENGVVFLVKDDALVFPEGYSFADKISRSRITGDHGHVILGTTTDPDTGKEFVPMFYYARIHDDCYYGFCANLNGQMEEAQPYFDRNEYLRRLEDSFDADIILVRGYDENTGDDGMIDYVSSDLPQYGELSGYGITKEILDHAIQTGEDSSQVGDEYELDGEHYDLSAYPFKYSKSLLFLLIPSVDNRRLSSEEARMNWMLFVAIGIILTVWLYSVLVLVRDHSLTEEQKILFSGRQIRKKSIAFSTVGAVILCAASLFLGSLFGLYRKSAVVERSLEVLKELITENDKRQEAIAIARSDMYLDHTVTVRDFFVANPDMLTKDGLKKACSLMEADYIMLYDESGKEILSSNDMRGLKLGTTEDSSTWEFRKLITGVAPIAHKPALDERTGKTQALFGVSFPLDAMDEKADQSGYGILLVAGDPSVFTFSQSTDISRAMQMIVMDGTVCFGVDPETNRITYASDESLIGKDALVLGLPDEALRDGYKGFFSSNAKKVYGATMEVDNMIYCYASNMQRIYKGVFRQMIAAFVAGFVFLLILSLVMLRGYEKDFDIYCSEGKELEDESFEEGGKYRRWKKFSMDPSERWLFYGKKYGVRTPLHDALTATQVLFVLFVLLLALIFGMRLPSETSVISYMLTGKWARGWNLFAFTNILLLLCEVGALVILSRFFLHLIGSLLGTKGETVCRLLLNLVSYLGVIIFAFVALSYLGIDTTTLLASLGLASFALSLGLKDLVTDIVAGIFIVFEGEYQVGDIIEVAGVRGTVVEVGVRTTKLEVRGGNIKIIGNRDMKNVLNMTRKNSWCAIELNVPADLPLVQVGELFRTSLPEIGGQIPEIISGPDYKGVIGFGHGTMTLSIIAECNEIDYFVVQRKLNEALKELCEKNDIKLQ